MRPGRLGLIVALIALAGASAAAEEQAQRTVTKQAPRAADVPAMTSQIQLERIAPAGAAADCGAFILDLWTWVNANHGASNGAHRIGAKMAAVKIRERGVAVYPWGHGSYSEGGFGWSGEKLVGRFQVLFSDRKAASGARFDGAKADIQDVTLYKDGRVEVMLRSWGNAILKLEDLRCYQDGFLTGIKREGNGVSLVSFALRKEVITPDSHPATLWP